MGGIVDTVLDISDPAGFFKGLSGQTAAEGTARALEFQREGAERQAQAVERARNEIFGISPAAMDASRQGFQGAIDVSGQAAPIQAAALLGGNVAAQNQLLAGLPQIQNALLGSPVNMSAFQPVNLGTPDFSFLNRTIPAQLDLNTLLTNPAAHTVTENPLIQQPPNVGTGDGLISRVLAGAQGNPVGGSGILSGMTDRLLSKVNSGQPRDSVLGGAVDRLTERIR